MVRMTLPPSTRKTGQVVGTVKAEETANPQSSLTVWSANIEDTNEVLALIRNPQVNCAWITVASTDRARL